MTPLVHNAVSVIAPLAKRLAEDCRIAERPLVLGVSGSPGSGKSTAARLLKLSLRYHGLNAARLSLDDLYLSRSGRERTARDIHPLFRTRGVPGTHDVDLGERVLDDVAAGRSLRLPRFDKANDDLRPVSEWSLIDAPIDLLIFEGWCVGTNPQCPVDLVEPVNALEREEDGDAVWRTHANECLAAYGSRLYARVDRFVHLLAGDIGDTWRWRR